MQYGKIEVSKNTYENDYETVLEIFKKLKPYDISYWIQEEIFAISGICNEFDNLDEGDLIPEYEYVVDINNGKKEVRFYNPEI